MTRAGTKPAQNINMGTGSKKPAARGSDGIKPFSFSGVAVGCVSAERTSTASSDILFGREGSEGSRGR